MGRAAKICPRCPNPQPCADHPQGWKSSNREQHITLSGSAVQARAQRILQQYRGICHVCREPGADQVDHVICIAEGGADDETNLRPIHADPCHSTKTRAEARRGRARHAS